jgi:hypothetical protein
MNYLTARSYPRISSIICFDSYQVRSDFSVGFILAWSNYTTRLIRTCSLSTLWPRARGSFPMTTAFSFRVKWIKSINEYVTYIIHSFDIVLFFRSLAVQLFNFDMKDIEWPQYNRQHLIGIKQYLLREDLTQMPKCIVRIKR